MQPCHVHHHLFVVRPYTLSQARLTFIKNHPLKPPGDYEENFGNTAQLLAELNAKLKELESLIHCSGDYHENIGSHDQYKILGF